MFDIEDRQTEVFNYNYKLIKGLLIALAISCAAVYYFHSIRIKFGFWFSAVCSGIIFLFFLDFLCKLYRVTIDGDTITVKYFLPFKRERQYAFTDIKYYGHSNMILTKYSKKRRVGGILKPANADTIILWQTGTDRFEELDKILSALFPPPKPNASMSNTLKANWKE